MKDVFEEDIQGKEVKNIYCRESGYNEFEITLDVDSERVRLVRLECSRCSDNMWTRTYWLPEQAQNILDKYAHGETLRYSWNHNPSTWDDDNNYNTDVYYNDGLDGYDELYYLD